LELYVNISSDGAVTKARRDLRKYAATAERVSRSGLGAASLGDNRMGITELLRRVIETGDYSWWWLQEQGNLTYSELSAFTNGTADLNGKTIDALMAALGINAKWVIRWDEYVVNQFDDIQFLQELFEDDQRVRDEFEEFVVGEWDDPDIDDEEIDLSEAQIPRVARESADFKPSDLKRWSRKIRRELKEELKYELETQAFEDWREDTYKRWSAARFPSWREEYIESRRSALEALDFVVIIDAPADDTKPG
jgi:hypothetical protein